MKKQECGGVLLPLITGLLLGSIFSFYIMVPAAEEKKRNTVCHNGLVMERVIGEQFTTFERIGAIQECENN